MRIYGFVTIVFLTGCVATGQTPPPSQHYNNDAFVINSCAKAAQYAALAGRSEGVEDCVQRHRYYQANPTAAPLPAPTEQRTSCKAGPYDTVECVTITQ